MVGDLKGWIPKMCNANRGYPESHCNGKILLCKYELQFTTVRVVLALSQHIRQHNCSYCYICVCYAFFFCGWVGMLCIFMIPFIQFLCFVYLFAICTIQFNVYLCYVNKIIKNPMFSPHKKETPKFWKCYLVNLQKFPTRTACFIMQNL